AVVSEFVEGPALATARAARRGFTAPECLELGVQLLTALAALHELGHIHGDISPANIILRPAGHDPDSQEHAEAVLVDLLHAPGQEAGTRGFRAPEVAVGLPGGAGADVYAAAQVCLWVAQPDARRHLAQVLEPLLAADPDRRPSAREATDLLAAQHRVAILTPPHEALAAASLREQALRAPTTRVRGLRPARRQRGRSVLVAILAVCVLAGALLWAGVLPPGASKENATATPERPSNTQEGLAAAVRDLVAARDDALQTGDGQALAALT